MTSKQLMEVMTYNSIEPFGHDTLFFLIGQLTSILYNVNKGKNASNKRPMDFVPFIKKPMKKQNSDEMKALLSSIATDPKKPKPKVEEKITQTKRYKKRMRLLKEQEQRRK